MFSFNHYLLIPIFGKHCDKIFCFCFGYWHCIKRKDAIMYDKLDNLKNVKERECCICDNCPL